jgi:hypothetical protein
MKIDSLKRMLRCSTRVIFFRIQLLLKLPMGMPSINISPEVGEYTRESSWPSVLFPEPLFPMTKVVSPAGKKKLAESKLSLSGCDEYTKDS